MSKLQKEFSFRVPTKDDTSDHYASLSLDSVRRIRDRHQTQQNIPWFVMVLLVIARVVVGSSGAPLPLAISLVFSLGLVGLIVWASQLLFQLEHMNQKSLLLCLKKGGRQGTLDFDEADRRTLRAIEDKKIRLAKFDKIKGWMILGSVGLLLFVAALPWMAAQDTEAFVFILPGFLVLGTSSLFSGLYLLRRYKLSPEERAIISMLAAPKPEKIKRA